MAATRKKLIQFLRPDAAAISSPATSALSSPRSFSSNDSSVSDDDSISSTSSFPPSASSSPSHSSPHPKSPWSATHHLPGLASSSPAGATGLIASLVKEGGKVYSLASAGDVLYVGTDSETVRAWRDGRDLAALRSGSGLVKAIVVAADGRIFTGHQDGKIRVWRRTCDAGDGDADPDAAHHRRVGSLPAIGDYLASSVNPSSYVAKGGKGRGRRRRAVWLRHTDAVSCLSLDEGAGLLYSGSWDRTFKVWRVADSRCLESVAGAHDDAVNTVAAAGFGGLVLTGSADGTVKVWRRELVAGGERTRHVLERVLREGGDGGAVTAIAACPEDRAVYVGTSDGLVTCWQWGPGGDGEPRLAGVLAGHRMGVMCLAVSGRVVVSGSADRTLCVWRRDDGGHGGEQRHVRLALLAGHAGPVKCVAVAEDVVEEDGGGSDDGERRFVVYSGSLDGSVKVWRLSEDRPLEAPAPAVTELMESEAWTGLPSSPPVPQAWAAPPEMKRVAAA